MRIVEDLRTLEVPPRTRPAPSYFVGLDLGQAKDYTALCILERHGQGMEADFHARHLQRYPLGTSYPSMVADVSEMLRRPELGGRPTLAIDRTGCGAAVGDMFKEANLPAELFQVMITGGDKESREDDIYRVPKRDLVGVTQVALQTGKLKVAASLSEAATLTTELQNFQVKITDAANDVYGAWRDGAHDDLVLAVALALWAGRRPVYAFFSW